MLKIIKYLRPGLVLSAITVISLGLSTASVNAQEEEDEKEKEASSREILVECDKGQSVQKILIKFANDTKPLEITVKGTCSNEPGNEVQIERDKVEIIGDEEFGGTIPTMLVDGARGVGFGDKLTIAGDLNISAGQVEIGSETEVTIEGAVNLVSESMLRIDTEASDDNDEEDAVTDENTENGAVGGKVTIMGPVWVFNHSLLQVHREVADGIVRLEDSVRLELQSSLYISDATVGNIELNYDSHALLEGEVTPRDGAGIYCDSESRVWGDATGFLNATSCQGMPY